MYLVMALRAYSSSPCSRASMISRFTCIWGRDKWKSSRVQGGGRKKKRLKVKRRRRSYPFRSGERTDWSLGGVWKTSHSFDVQLQISRQQLVHLPVVVIVVPGNAKQARTCDHRQGKNWQVGRSRTDSSSPYSDHAVDVIPDGSLQVGAVQGGQAGHAPEPVIQEVPDVRIQPVHQGKAVVLPRIVLQDKTSASSELLLS